MSKTIVNAKRALVDAMREALVAERAESTRLAKDAAEAATHEENRPEGDKDMRSTEASYVARGQAERVRAIEHTLATLASLTYRELAPGEPISAPAIVETECAGVRVHYFLVPLGGGMKIPHEGRIVATLATTSPLGRALVGANEGDEIEMSSPQGLKVHTVMRAR